MKKYECDGCDRGPCVIEVEGDEYPQRCPVMDLGDMDAADWVEV